jgi:hypothetical protein
MELSETAERAAAAAAAVADAAWDAEPRAGVQVTCPLPGTPSWILRARVRSGHKKGLRINSNASADFLSKHFRRAPCVPFDRGDVDGRPGVYATEEDALKDAVRFRLWVEVGCVDVEKLLEEMAMNHAAAHAAFVNQTKRVATWATRVVKHHTREVKKAEAKKRKRQTESRLRYQEAYNDFKEQEGALSGGEEVLKNTRYEVVLAPTDAGAKGNKGVHVSVEFAALRERLRTQLLVKVQAVRVYFGRLAAHAARKMDEGAETVGTSEYSYDDAGDGVYESPSHAIAREVGEELKTCCGRTLRAWAREWMNDGAFKVDMRGASSEEHLLDEEDVRLRFVACLRERSKRWGAGGLTIDHFQHDVNTMILPALLQEDLPHVHELINTLNKDVDDNPYISRTTAYLWMLRCGARRSKGGKGYYTDLHERDDVKAYRVEYLHANRELGWRTAMWIQLTLEEYEREVT